MRRLTRLDNGDIVDPRETPEKYTLEALRNPEMWTNKDVRAEYSRLRQIAMKRLETLGKYEITRNSQTYKRNINKYKPLTGMTTGETKLLLHDLARFIGAKRGTYSGFMRARQKAIETLQEHDYSFINEENFENFADFMDDWKSSELRGYGSLVALDFYEAAVNKKISPEDLQEKFNAFLEKQKNMKPRKKNKKKMNSSALVSEFERYLE